MDIRALQLYSFIPERRKIQSSGAMDSDAR